MYLEFVWQASESLVIAGLGAQNTRKILERKTKIKITIDIYVL